MDEPGAYLMQWVDGPADGEDPAEFASRSRFDAIENTMMALRREMRRQGMVDGDAIPAGKLERARGEVVTPEELRAALSRSDAAPPPPVADFPAEVWRERWASWLEFLAGAQRHGGFRIERATMH